MASKVLKARNTSSSASPQAAKKKPARKKAGADAGKTVEEIYQKKTQLEHILLRPDTYIGSVESNTKTLFVVDPDAGFVQREITYVPGLYKIFDEIIVNAADNKIRDPTMDCIKVTIDKEKSEISVYNTGKGIPVQVHAKEGVYVPELIFGHLLTSSNYDDKQKKVTGGRNGYGAKLCNIFSSKFIVETCDTATGKKYRQVFRDNMAIKEEPVIVKTKAKDKDFTRITFRPDLSKFNMSQFDDDMIALMARRVYDVAGTTRGIKVYLNNERLPVRNFKDYVNLVLRDQNVDTKVVHEVVNDRWEVCMTLSEHGFQQVSFVNSIATTKGGTHVNTISDQIVAGLISTIKRKNKGAAIKPHQIKNHMWLFVNCLIENPSFDSQTKENMTRRAKDFGSTPTLSDKFIKNIKDTGIVDAVLNWAKLKSQAQLSKASSGKKKSKISGIPKLDDANQAGGRNSHKCTLILTEGDSAKALAVSGLGVLGRDFYGVFPLRGKLLNVREASHQQIMGNTEIKHIAQIMGLKFGHEYTSTKQLRYGRLMIMTDQDQDGSHIKGLLINFIHHFWPSLLKLPDFLVEFVTPIVKCTKGRQEVSFFTIPQYQTWLEQQNNLKGWRIKYYKGLGTSTPQEAKQYFSHMDNHQIPFTYSSEQDFSDIVMAFSKKHVEARKEWLQNFVPGTYLDHDADAICYSDFINKELILFSMADNVRSIPSIMDGLKPGQRKVLFSCFKRKLKDEIKVAQLAGYVSEHSAYHHGEMSLAGTIVGMAQRFVGSNNLNLLQPIGQFGTRLAGGKDAASSRYIFTTLSPLARKIFHTADDDLLSYLEDDGQTIEPEFYAPILPMVLVNGSDGIGTGWSSSIPNFNPRDLVNALMALIDGEDPGELMPWYAGFEGDIIPKGTDKYTVRGKLNKVDDNTIEITELPIRSWTQPYKEFLEGLAADDGKKQPRISEFSQYHTDTTVRFIVTMTTEQMQAAEAKGLYKFFKLEGSLSTSNMTLFDPQGRIKKYESVQDILRDFYDVRLRLYQKRKSLLADRITADYKKMDNKVRFILDVISGALVINNRKKADILQELRTKGFAPFPKQNNKRAKAAAEVDDKDGNESSGSDEEAESASDFDYLLSMPMWNLTMERVEKLTQERNAVEAELTALLDKTPQDLWKEDLQAFVEALADLEAAEAEEELNVSTIVEKNLKTKGKKKKAGKRTQKKTAAAAAKKKTATATKKSKSKSKPAAGSFDEDEDEDGDAFVDMALESDDDWMPPGGVKVPAAKRNGGGKKNAAARSTRASGNGTATAKADKPKKQMGIADSLSKASNGTASTKRGVATAAAAKDEEVDDLDVSDVDLDGDDDDGEFQGGLFSRLQHRRNVAASPVEDGPVAASDDEAEAAPGTKRDAGRRAKQTKGKAKKATSTATRGKRGGRTAKKRSFDESRSPTPDPIDGILSDDEIADGVAGADNASDSEWELSPKKPARGRRGAAAAPAAAKKSGRAKAKKAAAAVASSTDTSVFDFDPKAKNSDEDDDDMSVASLSSRVKGKKQAKGKATKKRASRTTAKRTARTSGRRGAATTKQQKRSVIEDDDDDDDDENDAGAEDEDLQIVDQQKEDEGEDSWMPDSPVTKPKRGRTTKKAKTTKKKTTTTKKASSAAAASKKRTMARRTGRRALSSDDEDEAEAASLNTSSNTGDSEEEPEAGGRARRSRRARKKVNYAAMMESDEEAGGAADEDAQDAAEFKEDDSDFDIAEADDDSDFEP